jgi:CoA:oxalate CoA-transferase
MASVLEGIKVLDFTQVYSGPYCSLLLKDLGAEVIKVERPNAGDLTRVDVPHTVGLESGTFINLNRGKKSITIDLKSAKGRDICYELVKKVDVLLENYSPGTMEKLGLGSQELCKLNPKLVYASIAAYGQTGPFREYPGFDPIAQARGGLTIVNGPPETPMRCAVSIADFGAGMFTAMAIIGALFHRARSGEGQRIDMSMQDCIWGLTSLEFAPYYFLSGQKPPRLGNQHSAMVPCNLYTTLDGRVFINAGVLVQVHRLYKAIGRADLIDTPLGANQNERVKYRKEIDDILAAWTKDKKTDDIMRILKEADVPCTKLPEFDEVCNDPQLISRNMIIEVEQTISGKVKVPGSVFKLSKTPGNVNYPAPILGEHNYEVLHDVLGMSEAEVEKLANQGVL